jgi:hypothetical protein
MSIRALIVLTGIATLAACSSSNDPNRAIYNSLRTREQLQPAPGADRKDIPSYDDYQRSRARPATAD